MKKQMRFVFWLSVVIAMGLFLNGCTTKFQYISPPDDFLSKKDVIVGLIWVSDNWIKVRDIKGDPEYTGMHYTLGNLGLLGQIAADVFSDAINEELDKIKIERLMNDHFFSVFQRAFENNGFTVKINTVPYCSEGKKYCTNGLQRKDWEFKKMEDGYELAIDFWDYKPVILDLDIDYLFVIHLLRFGTSRSYSSIAPTSPPQGSTSLISYLIEGETEEVISQHFALVNEPVQGEWDEPPEYANLMKAAKASFERAIDEIFINVFKQAP